MASESQTINLRRIGALAGELGEAGPAVRFLSEYLQLLHNRVDKIAQALQASDRKASLDALTSLRVSSIMAGARAPEVLCGVIDDLVREGQFEAATALADSLRPAVSKILEAGPELLAEALASFTPTASG